MRFMATVHPVVPPERRDEFLALRDAEGERIRQQLQSGELEAIYFSEDNMTVWGILKADSLVAAQHQMEAYPLYPFMDLTITPLQ